MNYLDKN